MKADDMYQELKKIHDKIKNDDPELQSIKTCLNSLDSTFDELEVKLLFPDGNILSCDTVFTSTNKITNKGFIIFSNTGNNTRLDVLALKNQINKLTDNLIVFISNNTDESLGYWNTTVIELSTNSFVMAALPEDLREYMLNHNSFKKLLS